MSEHSGSRWRRSEIISSGTLITVLGFLWWFAQRAKAWDIVSDAQMGNVVLNDRVTKIESKQDTNFKSEMDLLHRIYDRQK